MKRNGQIGAAGDPPREVQAQYVQLGQSAVGTIDGQQVELSRSAARRVEASQFSAERSAVASASFQQGTLSQSAVGVLVAREVQCEDVRTVFLAAPVVRGNVRTLIDVRSALAIGFGMALGKVLIAGIRAGGRRFLR